MTKETKLSYKYSMLHETSGGKNTPTDPMAKQRLVSTHLMPNGKKHTTVWTHVHVHICTLYIHVHVHICTVYMYMYLLWRLDNARTTSQSNVDE